MVDCIYQIVNSPTRTHRQLVAKNNTMSPELIKEINANCPEDQGIFKEPYGLDWIKEPVIYMRWVSGGVSGGSCWGTEHSPRTPDKKPQFKALDLVLKELKPNITFLEFREIEGLIQSSDNNEYAYYGNRYDYTMEYVIISELEKALEAL